MISINNRAVAGKSITGVQRYVLEIERHITNQGINIIECPPQYSIGMKGYLWEQLILPTKSRGVLWSPANTGPLLCKNQVLTIHDVSPFDHPEWFSKNYVRIQKMLIPRLIKRVKHIITVSEFSKRRIVELFGILPHKITVIPLAADHRFKPISEDDKVAFKSKADLPDKYILSLGSIEPRKNLKFLINAWQAWEDRPTDLKLVIAGGSNKLFSEVNFKEMPEDIIFLGRVMEEDLPNIYACARCFVYPSIYEGFGLPPLEAMSCGVPVISSNSTSLPEAVGNAALMIDPFDVLSLVKALKSITQGELISQDLIEAGMLHVEKFSWQRTAQLTLKTLKEQEAL